MNFFQYQQRFSPLTPAKVAVVIGILFLFAMLVWFAAPQTTPADQLFDPHEAVFPSLPV